MTKPAGKKNRSPDTASPTLDLRASTTLQSQVGDSSSCHDENVFQSKHDSQSAASEPAVPVGKTQDIQAYLTGKQATIDQSDSSEKANEPIAFSWDPQAGEAPLKPLPKGTPHIAGYEIIHELGRGGMGVVYHARHRGLKREVAIKMLLGGSHASPEQLSRFRQEALAVADLQHPNIVQIYDVGEQDGLPYFSLEYVNGKSLDEQTNGKPQLESEAAATVEKLSQALAYAHERGIVHRDLKPANVLMTRDGEPKITDFGLVKRLEAEDSGTTRTGAIMGTPGFMAPEQARGEKDVGALADVYALGSTLYAMLTGRPPFLAATPMHTLMHLLNDEPVPPSQLQPQISRDIETICLKCLQKDPNRRYASAQELRDDLRRFLENEPISARPVGRAERVWRWCRRRRLVASLSAAALLLALCIMIGGPIAAMVIAAERDRAVKARDEAQTAKLIAEEAKTLAEENEQRAIAAQKMASDQQSLALDAFGVLVNKVQTQLIDAPATRQLKQDLLETGLQGLRKLAENAKNTNLADAMMVQAHRRMGDIFQSLLQFTEAREQFEQSHVIQLSLYDASPDEAAVQRELALSLSRLGDINRLEGNQRKAHDFYDQSLQLRKQISAGSPNDLVALKDLATSFVKLGNTSELDEARELYVQALAVREQILEQEIQNPNRHRDVWITLNKLAEISSQTGNLESEQDYYQQALEKAKDLLDLVPHSFRAKLDLADAYIWCGVACDKLDQKQEAKIAYDSALDLLLPLASEDPNNLDVHKHIALALSRKGDFSAGAAAAKKLRSLAPNNYRNLYNVACCYALCANAIDRLPEETKEPQTNLLRQDYANEAIEALLLATEDGLQGAESVSSDPDLTAIQNHPKYSQLLALLSTTEQENAQVETD